MGIPIDGKSKIQIKEMKKMSKDLIIRSSSAEFLIFERQTHDKGIQVRFEDGDLWLTQKAIGELFNVDRTVVTKHIKNIYSELELNENSTSANYALVQKEGNREITRNVLYYNLDMVISVGYRTNSDRAIQFRRWATYVLKEFSKKGYIIDKKRMANGAFFDEDYYDSLLAEIREIRLSERRFYQKVTDIYATKVWIMIKSLLQQLNFLKKFKIKCIMRYRIKRLLKLYIIEQIQKKKIWVLLLGEIHQVEKY